MRALMKLVPGPGLSLEDIPTPEVGPDEVRIRVKLAAVCGTDLHIHDWDDWAQATVQPPLVVGHEFMGVIESVGDRVGTVAVGDRVAGEGHIVCGTCRNCRAGRHHLCRATQGIGVNRDGAFADYIVMPEENVYRLPDSVPDEIAAILDPLGNAVHTALSFDLVGEDVLITGAGPIGQMAVAVSRHAGARNIVITDPVEARLDRARAMGATRAVVPGPGVIDGVMAELEMVEGFDVGLEMSGHPGGLADMVDSMIHSGKVALLGLFGHDADVDLNQVIIKGLTLKGIYGREMFETWHKALAMLATGLDITPTITHRFALEQFEDALAVLSSGEASKVVLEIRP
jgi:threonine 3-dehydrogenase